MAVLEGVCRGLTYMHHDISPPLLHRDIKAANILLRGGTKGACIADFGLARLMQVTRYHGRYRGTAYCEPELSGARYDPFATNLKSARSCLHLSKRRCG